MINKKGFTLIEVVITILIIGILVGIAVPAVLRYIEKGKDNYYNSLEQEVVLIGRDYYAKNKRELPRGQLDSEGNPVYISQVFLDDLKSKGYVTNDVVDADGEPCSGYVRVEKDVSSNNYTYVPCLICSDKYKSDNEYCTIDGETESKTLTCNIKFLNGYEVNTWTNKEVETEITSSYTNDNKEAKIGLYKTSKGVTIKPNNNVGKYNVKETTDNLTIYTYDRLGNKGTCQVSGEIKIEKEKPTCSSISAEYNSDKTKKIITVTATDGISGVESIKFGESSIAISGKGNSKTGRYEVSKNGTYYAIVEDVAGNISSKDDEKCIIKIDGLDSEPPVITLEVKATSANDAEGKVTIKAKMTDNIGVVGWQVTTDDKEPTSWNNIASTKETIETIEKEDVGTYYIWAKDEAGNVSSKKVTIKFDDWSDYTDTACNTSNSALCNMTNGYRKYTRGNGTGKVTTEYCGYGTVVAAANYNWCGGGCSSYASVDYYGCRCTYRRNGVTRTSTSYSYKTYDGCEYYCCSVLGNCQNYYLLSQYKCGTSIVSQGTCCQTNPTYKCNYNCSGIAYFHPTYGNNCYVTVSGTNCIVAESRNTTACPSGYPNDIGGTCYPNYPSTYTFVTSCLASNTVKCDSATMYQTRSYIYTIN